MRTKIKINDLVQKINDYDKGSGDFLFQKLVEENLNMLKAKCW